MGGEVGAVRPEVWLAYTAIYRPSYSQLFDAQKYFDFTLDFNTVVQLYNCTLPHPQTNPNWFAAVLKCPVLDGEHALRPVLETTQRFAVNDILSEFTA